MRSGELLTLFVAPIAVVAVLRADTPAVTGPMKIARGGHQATLLRDGRVLVSGGSDDSGNAIGPAEIFNPVTGAWSMAHANVVPRIGHAAVLLRDGRVLVVGGVPSASSSEAIGSAEL
ncbi:MAG TPA: kelch repeat-containing protein [Thermoanaerobaculia bacterium]